MVHDPLSVLDALMVALSGFVIVFLMLAALWAIIVIVSRVMTGIQGKAAAPAAAAPAPAPVPAAAPAAPVPPAVRLEGVDELTAACIMAIVSHETGISLDQLTFKSIKAL